MPDVGVPLDERAPRVGRALTVVAEAARPLRLGHLDDPVHEVAREDASGRRREPHADVARRVPGRRLEGGATDRSRASASTRRARLASTMGTHAVGDAARPARAASSPTPRRRTGTSRSGTSAPSGRRRSRVFQPTWSTCRCVHTTQIHLLGRDPGRAQVVEPRALAQVPGRGLLARLVVADARVDQHDVRRGADDEALDARADVAGPLVEEVGLEPREVPRDRLRGGVRQHRRRAGRTSGRSRRWG